MARLAGMGQEKRDVTVTIRVTATEKKQLDYSAGKLGMTNTEILMNGVKIIAGMIEKHNKAGGRDGRKDQGTDA